MSSTSSSVSLLNSSGAAGQIFMKYGIAEFYENLLSCFQFLFKLDSFNSYITLR
jgi:hypothetical protein